MSHVSANTGSGQDFKVVPSTAVPTEKILVMTLQNALDQDVIGQTNETAAPDDGATPSGLNGRLQRLAARLTSILAAIGGVSASLSTGQKKVATTGTQIALNTSSVALSNGVSVQASYTNVGPVSIGLTGVDALYDGTGHGKVLQPGQAWSFQVNNINLLFMQGTAGDWADWSSN